MSDLNQLGFPERDDAHPVIQVISARWPLLLSRSNDGGSAHAELNRVLLERVREAFHEAVGNLGLSRNELHWRVRLETRTADNGESRTEIVGDLAKDDVAFLVGRDALPTANPLGFIAGWMRSRLQAIRADEAGGELTIEFDFGPDFLAAICVESLLSATSPAEIESRFEVIHSSEQKYSMMSPFWSKQYGIRLKDASTMYQLVVDGIGNVIDFVVNGVEQGECPRLLPEPILTPVEIPTRSNPVTGTIEQWWPTQDSVDRSNQIAIIGILSPVLGHPIEDWDFVELAGKIAPEVHEQLQEAVQSTVSEILPTIDCGNFKSKHYQVGPAAGGLIGLEHYIVILFESRDALPPIIGNLSEGWIVVQIVAGVAKRMKSWISTKHDYRLDVTLSYPPVVLELLCKEVIRRRFHPRAQLSSQWQSLTSQFFGGYRSPAHPTEGMVYLVTIATKDRRIRYLFKVTGAGKVMLFRRVKGGKAEDLPLPDLLDLDGDF